MSDRRDRAAYAFWTHLDLRELYPELLLTIHATIRASVPLMEAAVAAARERAGTDAVAAGVAAYLARHVSEEQGHDEWLLDDLEALGYSRERVLRLIPSPTVAAMVGAQYYWAAHVHPICLLGYLAVLEGEPATVTFLEGVVVRTGLPHAAFRTFFKHAQLDPHHSAELYATLDELPLTEEQTTALGLSAMQTVRLLGNSFEELVKCHMPKMAAAV
ncbi:MAG: iron-containing redox enzyme family protein [Pyrinomonadaceae bacterium]